MLWNKFICPLLAVFVISSCGPQTITVREAVKIEEIVIKKYYLPPERTLAICGRGIPCNRYEVTQGQWYVLVTGSVDKKSCDQAEIDPGVDLCLPMKRFVSKERWQQLKIGDVLRTIYG